MNEMQRRTTLYSPLAGLDLDHERPLGVRLAGAGAGHLALGGGRVDKTKNEGPVLPAYFQKAGRIRKQRKNYERTPTPQAWEFSAVGFSWPS